MARHVADARPRRRVVVTGKVVDAQQRTWHGFTAWVYAVDDGTGRLVVVFGGVRPVPGIVEGVQLTVEGTAQTDEQGIALWNPFYRFVA